ncbi:tigger transposable element-derived protein 1-like [Macrobrachium rosenbergii]|uniref:tigger transposable element-derived protein 1-like n=1 Tax=Macrobrachium rosenbergii TaxID=79674 RepID=UPI0034D798A5
MTLVCILKGTRAESENAIIQFSMSSKCPSESPAGGVMKRHSITSKQKMKIIKQHVAGKAATAIGCDEHLSQSMVPNIIKDKKRTIDVVKVSASVHSTITITKKRTGPLKEIEQLLITWMEEQIQKHMPLSLLTIQTKEALILKGAAKLKDALDQIIVDEGYLLDQIFNVSETELYRKRMPERSYIHREVKTIPGFKVYKDRLALLLGGNVAGYKLKPFMIYHSANLRALARISKHMPPVYYRHNKKAWMTALLFKDWFLYCFIPEVEEYCRKNNTPFKTLLILDNASGHPQHIRDINENIKVVFLPTNTTSLIQPMDQGAVAAVNAYYLWNTLAQAVQATDNKEKDLRTFWKEFNVLKSIMNIGKAWKEVKNV